MKTYHKNPRKINEAQLDDLEIWLEELGDLSGVVHDLNSNEIIGGNQRSEVFDINECEIELTHQQAADAQGTVAHGFVVWRGNRYAYRAVEWTAEQCEKANIIANKAGGVWDFEILNDAFARDDLLDWGFETWELDENAVGEGGGEPQESGDAEPQTSRAEELRQEWGVETGQLWRLPSRTPGQEHRLICGDCTDTAVVGRLMGGDLIDCCMTDPPYGVDYDGGSTKREKLKGDSSTSLYLPSLKRVKEFAREHLAVYLWYADGDSAIAQAVAQAVAQAGYTLRRRLIWNKNLAQYGAFSQQYKQKHEPFMYIHLKGKSPYWAGDGTEVTVWDADRHPVNEYHPTQKPPTLYERAYRNSSKIGDVVYDAFCGSGTALIAAENLSRQCRAIEISPAYVAVALQRYRDAFGIEPELMQ